MEVNGNRTYDAASGVEMDFSRVTVLDPGSQAEGCGSDSYSYLESCLGCVVDVSGVDSRFVSDSSRGRGRNLAYDHCLAYGHRPWALWEEGEVAYLLDSLVLVASYPPRDASAYPSPSSLPPTSPSELLTSPALPPVSSLAQPSRRFAFVYFLPASRGQRPRPRHSLGVVFRAQRPYGPIPPALRQLDRACHGL